jgi:hypothetical protein
MFITNNGTPAVGTGGSNTISMNRIEQSRTVGIQITSDCNNFNNNIIIQQSDPGIVVNSGVIGSVIENNDLTSCAGTKI